MCGSTIRSKISAINQPVKATGLTNTGISWLLANPVKKYLNFF